MKDTEVDTDRMKNSRMIRPLLWIGLLGVMQYLFITTVLMYYYPGGHYFDHFTEGYQFTRNFLSDLGRTTNFGRGPNPTAPWYQFTLSLAGIAAISFISGFALRFKRAGVSLVTAAWVFGLIAGICYIGIANFPVNRAYFIHIQFVQWGFLAFLAMTVLCAITLQKDESIPTLYPLVIWAFAIILTLQVIIMILGPRSWSSPEALHLQVILQKVVVYAEIIAMASLCYVSLIPASEAME